MNLFIKTYFYITVDKIRLLEFSKYFHRCYDMLYWFLKLRTTRINRPLFFSDTFFSAALSLSPALASRNFFTIFDIQFNWIRRK